MRPYKWPSYPNLILSPNLNVSLRWDNTTKPTRALAKTEIGNLAGSKRSSLGRQPLIPLHGGAIIPSFAPVVKLTLHLTVRATWDMIGERATHCVTARNRHTHHLAKEQCP
jgi:hypothetical protein